MNEGSVHRCYFEMLSVVSQMRRGSCILVIMIVLVEESTIITCVNETNIPKGQ